MGCDAVARGAENNGLLAAELRVQVAEVFALLGATGRAVLRVEVQNDILATQFLQANVLATGCLTAEIFNDAVNRRSAHVLLLRL